MATIGVFVARNATVSTRMPLDYALLGRLRLRDALLRIQACQASGLDVDMIHRFAYANCGDECYGTEPLTPFLVEVYDACDALGL